MFEAEVAMERRSSFLPLLLMLCLVAGIVGLAGYLIFQVRAKTPVSATEANAIVTAALQAQGPAVIHFHVGTVKASAEDNPGDPNYRLLEKAGIVKLGKSGRGVVVSITPAGERLIADVPGFKKTQEKDGTFLYAAPIASRQFVSVAGVTMVGSDKATVEYNWKWVPNQLGNVFDAGGTLVKSFNLWERQNLINKYQVDFYNAGSTKSTIAVARYGKGWKVATL